MKRLLSIGLALLLGTAATAATAGDYRERHYDDRPYHRYDRDVGWERHDDWRRHDRHDRYWRSDRHWRERDWRHAHATAGAIRTGPAIASAHRTTITHAAR